MKRYNHLFLDALLVQLIFFSIFASDAYSYLGPGAGLGLIGSLFAAVIVILVIVFGLILYPIRRLKKLKAGKTPHGKKEGEGDKGHKNTEQ